MREKWLPVIGYEERYEVSNLGRVRGVGYTYAGSGMWTILKQKLQKNRGYCLVWLYDGKGGKKLVRVHRLVLDAFRGPQPTLEAAHRDGDRANNTLSNLRWKTKIDNEHDKIAHGTIPRKMTITDVRLARRLKEQGSTFKYIANLVGVSPATVHRAVHKTSWRHIK